MKKLLFPLIILALLINSCVVDENDDETNFDQTDLYGTWKQVNPDPTDEDFDSIYHVFDATNYTIIYFYPYGNTEVTYSYTWSNDGIFKYFYMFNYKNEIQTLNSTTLSFKKYVEGILTEEYTCTKVGETATTTFDQQDLYGTWQQISPDPADEGFSAFYHTFTNSEYSHSSLPIDILENYTFEYNWNDLGTVTWTNLLGFSVKLEIQTLNSTTLTFKKYVGGVIDDEYTCTKVE
jgi:hypothetical protein